MNDPYPRTFAEQNKGDSPLAEIGQAILDDSKYESLAIGTIIHRCSYLNLLINQKTQPQSKNAQESFSISISSEAKHILSLIEGFYVMKTKHFESQHAILHRLTKRLKKAK